MRDAFQPQNDSLFPSHYVLSADDSTDAAGAAAGRVCVLERLRMRVVRHAARVCGDRAATTH